MVLKCYATVEQVVLNDTSPVMQPTIFFLFPAPELERGIKSSLDFVCENLADIEETRSHYAYPWRALKEATYEGRSASSEMVAKDERDRALSTDNGIGVTLLMNEEIAVTVTQASLGDFLAASKFQPSNGAQIEASLLTKNYVVIGGRHFMSRPGLGFMRSHEVTQLIEKAGVIALVVSDVGALPGAARSYVSTVGMPHSGVDQPSLTKALYPVIQSVRDCCGTAIHDLQRFLATLPKTDERFS